MGLKDKLYYKAKNYVEEYQRSILELDLGCSKTDDIPLTFLQTLKTVKALIKEISTVIDVGAYEGKFTQATLQVFPKIKFIYCFEPNAEKHDIILNNTRKNIHIFPCALSNERKKGIFYTHKDSTMNSIIASDKKIIDELFPWDDSNILEKEIQIEILDHLVKEGKLEIETPALMKIDTQGNELDVLEGAKNSLSKINICIVEHMFVKAYKNNYEFYDLVNFMKNKGFHCKGIFPPLKRPNGLISSQDIIFKKM